MLGIQPVRVQDIADPGNFIEVLYEKEESPLDSVGGPADHSMINLALIFCMALLIQSSARLNVTWPSSHPSVFMRLLPLALAW